MTDIDCDDFGIESAMRRATRIRWENSRTVPYAAMDADDCAPGLEVQSCRFVGGIACWDQDHDRSLWTPRKGGGAHLVVGGVAVVEIEPMGAGWWVSAGDAGCEMVSGSLGEAKVRALEMLSGDRLAGEVRSISSAASA